MDELERRLRAAMIGAPEAAPPRLLPSVYRRHRRHRHRLLAAYVAKAAAVLLAIPPLGHELGGRVLFGASTTRYCHSNKRPGGLFG